MLNVRPLTRRLVLFLALGTLLLFMPTAGAQAGRCPLRETGRFVSMVPVTPDGRTYAAWSPDKMTVLLCDTRTGAIRHRLSGSTDQVGDIQFAPDGRSVITRSAYGEFILWDATTGMRRLTLQAKPRQEFWYPFAFSPDGKLLALATLHTAGEEKSGARRGGLATVWEAHTGRQRTVLGVGVPGQSQDVALDFLPDNRTLVTHVLGDTRFWDCSTGQLKRHVQLRGLGFTLSPDGKTAALENSWSTSAATPGQPDAASNSSTVELRDMGSLKLKHRLTGHTYHVARFRFSPDSRTLITIAEKTVVVGDMGQWKHELKAWDVRTGQLLWELPEDGSPSDVLWTSNGRELLTTDYRVLDAGTGQIVQSVSRSVLARSYGVMLSPRGALTEIAPPAGSP